MGLEPIQQIVQVAQSRYQKDQLLVIAIDGAGGAGKSTLCQTLAAQIATWAPPQVLKLDDFYHPLDRLERAQLHQVQARQAYFNVDQFKQNILRPLRLGHRASYKPIHWLNGEGEQAVELLTRGVLLLDGVFSFSKPLRDMVDLSLFVDTPPQLRQQRLLARPQLSTDWVSHWQATEAWHHEHEQTANAVDFVFSGSESLKPTG